LPRGTACIGSVSDRANPGETLDIYVMKAKPEGKKNRPRNLTKTPDFDDCEPSFCSNGDKIVFTTLRDEVNNDFNENIYVMNSDGTGVTQLTSNTAFDADANFSPDCTKIVFRSGRVPGDNSEVFEMDAVDNNNDGEGDNMCNISNDPTANDAFPAYSPDGTKIVFRSGRTAGTGVTNPEGDTEVFVINVNLTGLTQLTENDDADNFPDWGVAPT
jgi:Tol biopolymer transport system component